MRDVNESTTGGPGGTARLLSDMDDHERHLDIPPEAARLGRPMTPEERRAIVEHIRRVVAAPGADSGPR